ncbi:hypothetical protein C0J50_20115 [Silurus asotus]|uniref:Reverse transcriptase domain-containing protein n=1 Tax=Silurus asotus TaxID=30991 RepID=A0AAD5AQN2_SILAS|nr:hypothetical protein C0J50_20115 [Silurus asotus]
MEEIRLSITASMKLLNCNVMIFTKTWLHSGIPDNAIDLAGRHTPGGLDIRWLRSAFNTIIPSKLLAKLANLGINTSTCNWILDFLTNRPQQIRSGFICSNTITLNTGVPQGCVLSPFLYFLFTSHCRPVNGSNSIIKFVDDTTVIGLITNNDETAYREIQHIATWCNNYNLLLNTSKTKKLIVDFRKESRGTHDITHIIGMAVERVSSFKFLGIHFSADLSWTNMYSLVKKAHQRLFFLRTLKKNQLSSDILVNF